MLDEQQNDTGGSLSDGSARPLDKVSLSEDETETVSGSDSGSDDSDADVGIKARYFEFAI